MGIYLLMSTCFASICSYTSIDLSQPIKHYHYTRRLLNTTAIFFVANESRHIVPHRPHPEQSDRARPKRAVDNKTHELKPSLISPNPRQTFQSLNSNFLSSPFLSRFLGFKLMLWVTLAFTGVRDAGLKWPWLPSACVDSCLSPSVRETVFTSLAQAWTKLEPE